MTLAQLLLHALKKFGARQIWGIPGDFILPFFREMEQSEILPLYSLSHEPSIAFAADASGRLEEGVGVVAVTYGAGALNCVNAVAQAYAERSPLVVIAGVPSEEELSLGLQLHHQVKTIDSQATIFNEITCAQLRLNDVTQASEQIEGVLKQCKEESRPVLVEIPRNMATVPCEYHQYHNVETEREPTHINLPECVSDLCHIIREAARPVVIAGVEVKRYHQESQFCEWLRRIQVPGFTTLMGTGIAAEVPDSPIQGVYLGSAGDAEIANVVAQSDLVIMVGVILSDSNFAISAQTLAQKKAVFIQHREVNLGHYSYHGIALSDVLSALCEASDSKRWQPQSLPCLEEGAETDSEQPIKPMMIAEALNRCFEKFGKYPVASDVGDCLFVSQGLKATTVVAPGYYASMGFAVPAAFGIQASAGRRAVVIVGDGAFQMTGLELGHCKRYGFTPIVVVLNNQGWEMIRAFAPDNKAADLGHWSFAALAEILGGKGIVVSSADELTAALEQAFYDPSQFYLIDVQIAKGTKTPGLAHFAEVLTARQNMTRR